MSKMTTHLHNFGENNHWQRRTSKVRRPDELSGISDSSIIMGLSLQSWMRVKKKVSKPKIIIDILYKSLRAHAAKKKGLDKCPEAQSRRHRQEQPTPRHRRTHHNVAQSTHTSDRNVSGTSVGARTSFTFETKADLDGYTRSRGELG